MRARSKKGVIRVANRAITALKDLYEDAHTVNETRDAARGYLHPTIEAVQQIEAFVKSVEQG